MKPAFFATTSPGGSSALKQALGDPGVARIARTLHLDLRDPATLNGLLAMTQQYVDASPEVGLRFKQLLSRELTPDQSRHAREAVRTYQKIAAMN